SGGIGVACVRCFRHTTRDHSGERGGDILECRRLDVNDSGDGGGQAFAAERLIATEHFVEDQAKGEEIGASVVGLLQQDLRSHVGGSAAGGGHGLQTLGGFVGIAAPGTAGDAEVENLYPIAGGDHDVLGLDVAVDDAFLVSGLQAFAALSSNGEKFLGGNRLRE